MKKVLFIIGLFFLIFGYLAFQNAIDNLVTLEEYIVDAQAGMLPGAVQNNELDVMSEAEMADSLRRGEAILQVSRAFMAFGFVIFVYSLVDDIKKIKNKLL